MIMMSRGFLTSSLITTQAIRLLASLSGSSPPTAPPPCGPMNQKPVVRSTDHDAAFRQPVEQPGFQVAAFGRERARPVIGRSGLVLCLDPGEYPVADRLSELAPIRDKGALDVGVDATVQGETRHEGAIGNGVNCVAGSLGVRPSRVVVAHQDKEFFRRP